MTHDSSEKSVRAFLENCLPKRTLHLLQRASDGWNRPLFAYDSMTDSFEPAANLEVEDPDTIDALCIAAECLLGFGRPTFADTLVEPEESAGFIDLTYRFNPEEADIYHHFCALLTQNMRSDAGFVAEFQKYPQGFKVLITITYLSDFDYQQKKDTIEAMLFIARKWAGKTPFLGEKL